VVTGKRKATYEPNEGEEKSVNGFIQRTKAKKAKTYKDE
jgi:ribosomal protein L34